MQFLRQSWKVEVISLEASSRPVQSSIEHIRLDDFMLNIKLIAVLLAEFAA